MAYGKVVARVAETAELARREKPDIAVLIDSWGFTLRVAHRLRQIDPDLPLIKYVAPQVWASRPGRAKTLAAAVDHLLAIHTFDVPFFEREGLPTTFVGASALARNTATADPARLRTAIGAGKTDPILLVLPGSRPSEIRRVMPPFEAAVKEAHTGSIMPAHHALNGMPCHMNSWLLDTVLRQEWGFDGFVTSDMGDIPKLAGGHKMAHDETESAVCALSAGVDMELVGRLYMGNLLKALKAGKIPISVIDEAARRVLREKIELLGIGTTTNAPSAAPNEKTKQEILNYKGDDDIWAKLIADGKFNTPASGRRPDWQKILNNPSHDALALETAQKAIVLLKNANSLLPLDKTKLKKIVVVGPLATQRNLGGYSTGNPKFYVNILDGLKTYLGSSVEVGYAPGCQLKDASVELLAPAVALAQSADVVIVVVGHLRAQLGENLDRDDLGLIGGQLKLVQAVAATGKPVVVVFQNGAPITEPWICDHIPAIVESWYLGQATGMALAQMLFGDVNPGGKMPVSVACSIGQIPCYYNHAAFHGPINYYGAKSGNLFCFGHGLSYTTFKYNGLKIEPVAIAPNQVATVTVAVSNTGARAGDEVVQLYCHQSYTSLKRPVKELKGFPRVTLAPGESKTVSFAMGFEQLKFWKDGKWITEAGDVDLMVGSSSDDIRQKGKLVLAATK